MTSIKHFSLLAITLLCGFSMFAQRPNLPQQPGQVNVNNSNTNATNSTETLRYVNSLFNLYNKYNSHLSIDTRKNEIIFTDKFSELRADFAAVEFRRSGENIGIFCKDGSECLSSKDVDTGEAESSRIKYTFGVKEDDIAVPETEKAIDKLNTMLGGLSRNTSSYASNLSTVAKRSLRIINDAFNEYNNYGTIFSMKGDVLHWDSRVANVKVNIKDITFYIDYGNQWIVMKCIDGDCLEGSASKDSYSMGLNDGTNIAPNIEEVLQAFNNLRRDILTN